MPGGTLRVLEACRRNDVGRLVHASTSAVYGSARLVPMPESHPLQPQSPYAATKLTADALVESMRRCFGVPAVVVRPFNTYGPRQSTRAVLSSIVAQLVQRVDELERGDVRAVRDFVHVSDTVAGFLAAATVESALGEVLYFATGLVISVGDAARCAMRVVGREIPIRRVAARERLDLSEVAHLCGDASAARQVLGWSPSVSLQGGVASVVDFVRGYPDRFRAP